MASENVDGIDLYADVDDFGGVTKFTFSIKTVHTCLYQKFISCIVYIEISCLHFFL